jgi:LysM repeat protein
MAARKRARYLAPIALVAVIVATILVVRTGLGTHHASVAVQPTVSLPAVQHRTVHRRFYVVQAGDSLSTISAKVGVPLATLESLNPTVDPNALQTGQRLRLR